MKASKRPGQSLIEVTMATMIAAITTTAVMSTVLSSFVADTRADKRDAATMAMRRAQETLKSFVSVEPTSINLFPGQVPAIPGSPNAGSWAADVSGWPLAGAACAWNSPPNVGTFHNISSLVNTAGSTLSPDGLPGATLTYTVCSYNCGPWGMGAAPDFPLACKRVAFTLTYTD